MGQGGGVWGQCCEGHTCHVLSIILRVIEMGCAAFWQSIVLDYIACASNVIQWRIQLEVFRGFC